MDGPLPQSAATLRPLKPDDLFLADVARLHLAMPLDWDPDWTTTEAQVTALREHLAEQLRTGGGLVLVAEHDGALVGLLWTLDANASPDAALHTDHPTWHVASSWVAPGWRRQGLATRLADELEHRARQQGVVELTSEVHRDNHAMLRAKRRWGHVVTGTDDGWVHHAKRL